MSSSTNTTTDTLTPRSSESDNDPGPSSLTIPQQWTNNPSFMSLDSDWTGGDDLKAVLQEEYGLGDVQPLITRVGGGDSLFILQSNSVYTAGYYIWNGISMSLYRIVEPLNLEQIYRNIDEHGGFLGGLMQVEVEQRYEDLEEEEVEEARVEPAEE